MYSSTKNNKNPLYGKHVLVSGATGFIGSHVVRKLLGAGCRVAVLVRPSSDFWRLQDIWDSIEVYYGDLTDLHQNELISKLSGIQIVFHLGAAGVDQSESDSEFILQTNVLGTYALLRLAHALKVERFIYCGSCFEYGNGNYLSEETLPQPVSEYGVSKFSASILVDMFHRQHALATVSLRPFTVYGSFEASYRLIPHAIMQALDGKDIALTGGEQTRDFVFIDDVVRAFLAAAALPGIAGEIFNISTGQAVAVKEVVALILELTASQSKALFGTLPYRKAEIWSLSGNPAKAMNKLNWKAQASLKEGLEKTIEWFEENRQKHPSSMTKR